MNNINHRWYYLIGVIVIILISGYIGYRFGFHSATQQTIALNRTAPEMAYTIVSENIETITDAQILSYLTRGLLLGTGQFASSEIIARMDKPEVKDLLQKHQQYLIDFKNKSSEIRNKYPELLKNQIR